MALLLPLIAFAQSATVLPIPQIQPEQLPDVQTLLMQLAAKLGYGEWVPFAVVILPLAGRILAQILNGKKVPHWLVSIIPAISTVGTVNPVVGANSQDAKAAVDEIQATVLQRMYRIRK